MPGAQATSLRHDLADMPACAGCGYDLRGLTEPRCPECGLPFDPVVARPPSNPRQRDCETCGYDLRGLSDNRCPECGAVFDANRAPSPEIPWLCDRRHAVASYFQTAWMVLSHPTAFGEYVWRDVHVNERRTRRFRYITVIVASASLSATGSLLMGNVGLIPQLVVVFFPSLFFFSVATATSQISPFTSTSMNNEQRFRGLQCMSCAGLAFSPIVPFAVALQRMFGLTPSVAIAALAMIGVMLMLWWYGALMFQLCGARGTATENTLHAVLLPFVWCMIAAVALLFACGLLAVVMWVSQS